MALQELLEKMRINNGPAKLKIVNVKIIINPSTIEKILKCLKEPY